MNHHKFSIIIPTKDRAITLHSALKTCIQQEYDNLDIIVSDNGSLDNTKEVVNNFNDPRIKYINTGKRMNMSANWEFALSHIKSGYVSFLGDDDGFLPNAISNINNILNDTEYEAVNAPCIEYTWPNHVLPLHKNKLVFLKNSVEQLPVIKDTLAKVLRSELPYNVLPWLYKGFVSFKSIQKVKSVTGSFFKSRVPDIYSAIAISSVMKDHQYFYTQHPFAINGASASSTGVSMGSENKNDYAAEFLDEKNIPFHSSLILCHSFPVYIYECYLQAKDAGLFKGADDPVELEEVLRITLKQVTHSKKKVYEDTRKAVLEIGKKNKIDKQKIDTLIKQNTNKGYVNMLSNKIKQRYFSEQVQINMDQHQVKNVYDAALIADKYLKNQILLPSKPGVIKMVTKDIKNILEHKKIWQ